MTKINALQKDLDVLIEKIAKLEVMISTLRAESQVSKSYKRHRDQLIKYRAELEEAKKERKKVRLALDEESLLSRISKAEEKRNRDIRQFDKKEKLLLERLIADKKRSIQPKIERIKIQRYGEISELKSAFDLYEANTLTKIQQLKQKKSEFVARRKELMTEKKEAKSAHAAKISAISKKVKSGARTSAQGNKDKNSANKHLENALTRIDSKLDKLSKDRESYEASYKGKIEKFKESIRKKKAKLDKDIERLEKRCKADIQALESENIKHCTEKFELPSKKKRAAFEKDLNQRTEKTLSILIKKLKETRKKISDL